jgi:hypothetical protein
MTDHQKFREWLALSAAGLLDPAEERRLREHLRDCPDCAAVETEFAGLASALANLAAPHPEPTLVARTEALVAADLSLQADRRQGAFLAGAAVVVAWGMTLTAWYGCRAVGGNTVAGLEIWLVSTCMGTLAAAALVRSRRLRERSWL